MERGSVIRGSRGYKKQWTCQRRSGGYLWSTHTGGRGVRGGCLLAKGWEWAKKEGGALRWTFVSDSVCNVSAVWCTLGSPWAMRHWLNYNTTQKDNNVNLLGRNRESILIESYSYELCLRQAAGDPRGSHSTRPGSEMERMGRGAVWLTLNVPLTLSPHWIPGLTQLEGTQ